MLYHFWSRLDLTVLLIYFPTNVTRGAFFGFIRGVSNSTIIMVNSISTDKNGDNENGLNEDLLEEELVRQVLQENPPEEKGERDEWKQHVGWHRIENVRLSDSNTSGNNNSNNVINGNTNIGRHGSITNESIRQRPPSLRSVNIYGDASNEVEKTAEIAQEVVNTVPLRISRLYNFQNPTTTSTVGIIACFVMIMSCLSIIAFCHYFSPSNKNRKRKRWINSSKRRTL